MLPTPPLTTAVVPLPCGWIGKQLMRKMTGFATSTGNHHTHHGLLCQSPRMLAAAWTYLASKTSHTTEGETMKRSTERILTTHVGSLVRPPGLMNIMRAKESGQAYDQEELAVHVRSAVREVVQKQVAVGVDVPSDGEYGKPSFSGYVNERLSGFERRPRDPNESPLLNWGRGGQLFREFYEAYDRATGSASGYPVVCTGPISYQGQTAVQRDIDIFKAALAGVTQRGGVHPGGGAWHDRAAAPERVLPDGRGLPLRHRRSHAGGISGHRGRRVPSPDRRSTGSHPVWHAGSSPQHGGLPGLCRAAG